MNLCTVCGEDFGSLEAFDAHRVGTFPQTGSAAYVGPVEGRRCLTAEEMRARGFVRNARGSLSLEKSLLNARKLRSAQIQTSETQLVA